MDNNELLAQITQLMEAQERRMQQENSRFQEEMRGEISTLRQSMVRIEGQLPKIDIVMEQQVDIIDQIKEMKRPERQITELKEQISDVASALSIHTNDTSIHVSPAV